MPKLLLSSPEILTDTSMLPLLLLFSSNSFLVGFFFLLLNHFQGYLTRKIFFLFLLLDVFCPKILCLLFFWVKNFLDEGKPGAL